jgi:ABC-type glutathione transport system ATPase component
VAEDAVMVDRGRIAERGRTGDLIRAPQHDSTAQFFGSMLAASCPGKPAS